MMYTHRLHLNLNDPRLLRDASSLKSAGPCPAAEGVDPEALVVCTLLENLKERRLASALNGGVIKEVAWAFFSTDERHDHPFKDGKGMDCHALTCFMCAEGGNDPHRAMDLATGTEKKVGVYLYRVGQNTRNIRHHCATAHGSVYLKLQAGRFIVNEPARHVVHNLESIECVYLRMCVPELNDIH